MGIATTMVDRAVGMVTIVDVLQGFYTSRLMVKVAVATPAVAVSVKM